MSEPGDIMITTETHPTVTEAHLELARLNVEALKLQVEDDKLLSEERKEEAVQVTKRVEAEQRAKADIARHRKMNGDAKGWTIFGLGVLALAGLVISWLSYNSHATSEQEFSRPNPQVVIGQACASSGGIWKENLRGNFECTRP